jgi:hypothetical protein
VLGALCVVALCLYGASVGAATGGGLGSVNADQTAPVFPATLTVPAAQTWLTAALTVRLTQVSELSSEVAAAKLVGSDRSALQVLLASTMNVSRVLLRDTTRSCGHAR